MGKMSVIDAGSGNIIKRIIDYSNKNPWLYAVYVVLVGLPTVLIITFCCTGSSNKTDGDKSSLNDPKKTDAHQEDDEAEEEQGEEGEANDENNAGDVNEEEETEEEEIDEPPTTRSQTRKRRPRKDN